MFINTRKVIVAASLLAVLFSMNALSSATASESLAPRLSDTANMLKSNRELINKFYDAFKIGDKAIILSYITDDFIMHVPGKGLNAGEYWGKEGFSQFLSNIGNYSGGDFSLSVPSLAINEDTIFTREDIIMNRKENPGEKWLLRFIMEYHIKDGLISEAWTIPQDPIAYDAFWTPKSQYIETRGAGFNQKIVGISDNDPFTHSVESLQVVRKFYHYFWKGDLNAMSKLVGDEFEFYTPGRSSLAGIYKGWHGYETFREKLIANVAGDKYKLEWGGYAASKNDVFVKEYIRMNTSWDKEVKSSFVILHFTMKEGKIAKIEDTPVDSIKYDSSFTKPVSEK
ncbi:nuclear transport factor 2 family protein [Serratia proteamaculans]|uniref:nuclear transport factor 2 family protein n=1 Tax=Serratia proteamaculans TaxID=28151 RepID=UPI0021BB8637|nr:nuclear transport factor 2 family protein [Serratia proteamaculans]